MRDSLSMAVVDDSSGQDDMQIDMAMPDNSIVFRPEGVAAAFKE